MAEKQKTQQHSKRHSSDCLPRRTYAIARLRKSEMKKLRGWLDNKDPVEVATDQRNGQVYIFNTRKTIEHHFRQQSRGEA